MSAEGNDTNTAGLTATPICQGKGKGNSAICNDFRSQRQMIKVGSVVVALPRLGPTHEPNRRRSFVADHGDKYCCGDL